MVQKMFTKYIIFKLQKYCYQIVTFIRSSNCQLPKRRYQITARHIFYRFREKIVTQRIYKKKSFNFSNGGPVDQHAVVLPAPLDNDDFYPGNLGKALNVIE